MIVVHLHTVLQIQTEQGHIGLLKAAWSPGLDLAGLLRLLDLAVDQEQTLLVVNGQSSDLDRMLQDGDVVHLIPAISGG